MLALGLLCCRPEAASAHGGERVLIVRSSPQTNFARFEARLYAELEAAGFEIVLIDAEPNADVTRLTRRHAARAAIRIAERAGQHAISVHVATPGGRKSSDALESAISESPERLALRSVELLYAMLLEVPETSRSRPAAATRLPSRRLLPSPETPRWSIHGSVYGASSAGGVGAVAGLQLGAATYVLPWTFLSAGIAASAPAVITEGPSSALLALGAARAGLGLEPFASARLSPALELRFGWLGALTLGSSEVAATRSEIGGSPFTSVVVSLSTRVRRALSVRCDLELGRSFQRLDVRFGGRSVAGFGQPWVAAGVGLEWRGFSRPQSTSSVDRAR